MSVRTLSWILLAAIALGAVLLFNYWASYQPLSTLVYAGIVAALFGAANLAYPFRFLGIRKRSVGALVFVGAAALAFAALFWPAPVIAAQHRNQLDEIMPRYQFSERHSIRIHASVEKVMQAVRQSSFGDMRSLAMLLKVRAAALRTKSQETGAFSSDKQILDAFVASGYVLGGSGHELLVAGGADLRAKRPLELRTLQQFADSREQGAVKMAFDFDARDAGDGWSTLTTETRVLALADDSGQGMARYWRLIVPGSGLLRRQWLDGIRRRAESSL